MFWIGCFFYLIPYFKVRKNLISSKIGWTSEESQVDNLLMDRCSSPTILGFLCLFQNTCNIHPNWSNLIYRKTEQWLFFSSKDFSFPSIRHTWIYIYFKAFTSCCCSSFFWWCSDMIWGWDLGWKWGKKGGGMVLIRKRKRVG